MTDNEQELKRVRDQIKDLQKQEAKLVKLVMKESSNFNKKFEVWMESNSGQILSDLFALREKSPIIREYIDKYDFNRCETVDFCDFFCDDLGWMIDDFKGGEEFYSEESRKEIIKFAEEMMKHNIKGVIFDW